MHIPHGTIYRSPLFRMRILTDRTALIQAVDKMDKKGGGKLVEFGAAEPEQSGSIPQASLTGPSSVRKDDTMARLQAAAQKHIERSQDNSERHQANWLDQYMVNEGLVEDPRFASAFEPLKDRGDETAVDDARRRSEDLPDFSWAGNK